MVTKVVNTSINGTNQSFSKATSKATIQEQNDFKQQLHGNKKSSSVGKGDGFENLNAGEIALVKGYMDDREKYAIENQDWVKKLPIEKQIYVVFGYYSSINMNYLLKKNIENIGR